MRESAHKDTPRILGKMQQPCRPGPANIFDDVANLAGSRDYTRARPVPEPSDGAERDADCGVVAGRFSHSRIGAAM